MNKKLRLLLVALCYATMVTSQITPVSYTANDSVAIFSGPFSYGSNMGYFPPWDDEELAEIAAGNAEKGIRGAGVRSLRPSLPEHFLEQWGYEARTEAHAFYKTLDIRDNTIFIGYPSRPHQDSTFHCSERPSELFRNMYTPIWDNGENGTPVNDTNFYALYLYRLATLYGDYARTWEIWNEPDFDFRSNAWKRPQMEGNWWTNDPEPCEYALQAPVQHYVRLLRISYEVIKTLRPNHYIAIGGLGYPSFLDAVLRNTDNPDRGLVTEAFPNKGGAYFDVMSFHVYPHIDGSMRDWNHDAQRFDYYRHSDAAVDGVIAKKVEFELVLNKYGYDVNLPQKQFIITECNIPRRSFGEAIGSDEAQRNFIIKTLVAVQEEALRQFYIFNLADSRKVNDAESEFHLMGMFENLENEGIYEQVPNDVAIAYKTTSDQLFDYAYDELQTQALLLPEGVRGAAFINKEGRSKYVLWAQTAVDMTEAASQSYTFSPLIPTDSIFVKSWDYSINPDEELIVGSTIQLTGSPVFLEVRRPKGTTLILDRDSTQAAVAIPFRVYPNPYTASTRIIMQLDRTREVSLLVYNMNGNLVRSFIDDTELLRGVYSYSLEDNFPAGVYIVKLVVDQNEIVQRVVKLE